MDKSRAKYFKACYCLLSAASEIRAMSKCIVILGAGRSSSSLIRHLLQNASSEGFTVRIGDLDLALAEKKAEDHPCASTFALDAGNPEARRKEIEAADLVISMLPAFFHPEVARDAIATRTPLITPSYLSAEIAGMDAEAKSAGIPILNELGLDPGIDHLSAMEVIDGLRSTGSTLTGFESYTGGLVAPESDDNPWHYKFTWNPRNVVLAGQGGSATFKENGRIRVLPPHRLFKEVTQIDVPGAGRFEGYANRDSLAYEQIYGIQGIDTLVRGTLRGDGFCGGWDAVFQLGMNRDDAQVSYPEGTTWRDFTAGFSGGVPMGADKSAVRAAVARATGADGPALDLLDSIGLFGDEPLAKRAGSPADILQELLENRWALQAGDLDMIVMWHRFHYRDAQGRERMKTSHLVHIGEDEMHTAMSLTVGLPLALAARMWVGGEWNGSGVLLPTKPDLYSPLLKGLQREGIVFTETDM
ncbi:MAG: saccharopine dehydrogenase [Crocinitomicaceae bacterium]|nr:saccharopine dehydrogenase [Crocinitomicaceae bacterium]